MRRVVITGVTGALGGALARLYTARGNEVYGVSRSARGTLAGCAELLQNNQRTVRDAEVLLDGEPQLLILCAGQIETEVGDGGLPLADSTEAIFAINALFPIYCALAAAGRKWERRVDVVAIGSIADGAPSPFGPVYHASKIALHYFYSAVAPIATASNPQVHLRVYRPGAIRGPLSWAPIVRLNEKGARIRARRCEGAPGAEVVAERVARWIAGGEPIGSYDEPLSFRALKLLFAVSPSWHHRLQRFGWRRGSKWPG